MMTVPGMLAAIAASPAAAKHPAVIGADGQRIDFAELDRRGRGRAEELAGLGVGEGDIVAVICYNEPAVFELLLGAGYRGAAIMPLSPALTDRELAALLEKADAVACLVSPGFDETRLAGLHAMSPVVPHVIGSAPVPSDDAPTLPAPDSTAWVSTTGGSTGTPRLYAISHERLVTNTLLNALEWGWRAYDIHLSLSPLAHGIGFSHAVGQLVSGGTVALVERYSPANAIAALSAGTAWTAVVPTMVLDLVQAAERDRSDLAALRLVVAAGAPLPVGLRDRMLAHGGGRRLIEYYGSTELGWVSWIEHSVGDQRNGIVGQPMLGSSVRIARADGELADRGEIGRIEKRGRPYAIPVAGGPSAYRANATAWETSGDVGLLDGEGNLVIAGREDDMVVVGGQNVYPVEVEAVLREHPAVREVVVRGVDNARLGAQLVAIVESSRAESGSLEAELLVFCAERLAKYKRPTRIVVLDALPRNGAGKLLRSFELPEEASWGR